MAIAISGLTGDITLGGNSIAYVNDAKMSISGAELDITKFGDADKRRKIGIKSGSGSGSGTFTKANGTTTTAGTLGAIMIESTRTTMTDEATTANGTNTVFTITDTDKRLISLDADEVPVVKYGTVPVTVDSTDYTIDYAKGTITFGTTPGAEAVTITGKYVTMILLPGFTKYSVDSSVSVIDVTQFVVITDPTYGWKRIMPSIGEWSASGDGFLQDDAITNLIAVALSVPKHFCFVQDQTNMDSFLYGQGSVSKNDIANSATNVVTQNISIVSSSTLYRSETNILWDAYQARNAVVLDLVTETGNGISSSAYITKLNISDDVSGVATFSFDYETDSVITVTL
jgi:hypothetical protein